MKKLRRYGIMRLAIPHRVRAVGALLVTLALFVTVAPGTASATPKHPFVEEFGSANEPSFAGAAGLAVDQSSGDVLVIDSSAKTLSRWHSDGTPSNFSALDTNVIDGQGSGDGTPQNGILGEFTGSKEVQVAVDNSGGATNGNIYVTDSSHGVVDIFGSDGTYLGQLSAAGSTAFGEACGVAVDPAGTVYVAEYGGQVHKFVPSGATPGNSDNTLNFAATEPCTLAAGAGPTAGYMFVASWGGPVTKYDAVTGDAKYVVDSGSSTSVSVDPATGHVYVATGDSVKEYDASGASSATLVSTISTSSTFSVEGVAIDESSGRVYVARGGTPHLEVFGPLVFGEPPVATTGGFSAVENTAATLEGSVNPNEDATTWQFEYGLTPTYGSVAPAAPESAGEGGAPVSVSTSVSGLQPGTEYHYRLRATNSSGSATGADMTLTTAAGALVETTGSPARTATTARLEGRVAPMGAATAYHFEYGLDGPCDSNPCQSTSSRSAGSGSQYVLVSEEVSGLASGRTYHYRLVADNGNSAGQSIGDDMTVTTRSSDTLPAPAPFPGPPGSDRGWEQVSQPDTGGNPVLTAVAISDNGERAIYQVNGGTPSSPIGSTFDVAMAERTPSGWRNVESLPDRSHLLGTLFLPPAGSSDLSKVFLVNTGLKGATSFRIKWGSGYEKLYEPGNFYGSYYEASADGTRLIMKLNGSPDPAHPSGSNPNLYDVSSGSPQMVSLLPDGTVPACGAESPQPSNAALPDGSPSRFAGWVSADGSRVVFPSEGNVCDNRFQLYLRDLTTPSTTLVSGPALSGPTCRAEFIKGASDAIFFWTRSRLAADDAAVSSCADGGGGDVYRFDISSGALDCVTCISPTVHADIPEVQRLSSGRIAVASDGSRVYFRSSNRLLPGAAAPGFYRVQVSTGNARYIAPAGTADVGDFANRGEAISTGGSVIVFRSDAAGLNPLGGSNNGGTFQYYRYDDRDRSLVCVSCPSDGSDPVADVPQGLVASVDQGGPNLNPLDEQGDFAFVTPTPLVAADQNTAPEGQGAFAGADAYEWRDGRLFLVTTGSTQWPGPGVIPAIGGITPSGHDLFFTASEQLTSDAVDAFTRLYDARIGGGFPPPPSVEESCIGAGCPEPSAGSPAPPTETGPADFVGPGNPKPHFRHKKHRKKKHHRHQRRPHHSKAKKRPQTIDSRRTAR